jgi:transaldolase
MKQLSESHDAVHRKLTPADAKKADVKPLVLDEKKFRYLLNEDAMATEKTAEGIRKFAADIAKLEQLVASKLNG